ncbi:MAG: hypothetical protein ACJ75G_05240 [Gaiellaceae bacterium]
MSEVKQAFTRAGLHHPKVDTKLPTTIFNYGKPPHAVSVTIFREKIPVVFSHSHGYRVSHLRNVMVYYSVSERRVVARALNSLE